MLVMMLALINISVAERGSLPNQPTNQPTN